MVRIAGDAGNCRSEAELRQPFQRSTHGVSASVPTCVAYPSGSTPALADSADVRTCNAPVRPVAESLARSGRERERPQDASVAPLRTPRNVGRCMSSTPSPPVRVWRSVGSGQPTRHGRRFHARPSLGRRKELDGILGPSPGGDVQLRPAPKRTLPPPSR